MASTHFHGVWGVVSPEPRCTVGGRNGDHARSIPVSREVRDRRDGKGGAAAAAGAAAGWPELHLAGRQRQV